MVSECCKTTIEEAEELERLNATKQQRGRWGAAPREAQGKQLTTIIPLTGYISWVINPLLPN